VRNAGSPLLSFSSAIAKADRDIKQFLLSRMYRHPRIIRIMTGAETVVRDLFAHYLHHPNDMPVEWALGLDRSPSGVRARRVADFIAGMTDRYALAEHARHFRSTPELL
jgi:dGTPase